MKKEMNEPNQSAKATTIMCRIHQPFLSRMKCFNMTLPQKEVSNGIDNSEIEKVFYPPPGRKKATQSVGVGIQKNHLADEKFWQEEENISQCSLEQYVWQCYGLGKIRETQMSHEYGADDDTETIDYVPDDDGFLVIEHHRYNENAHQSEEERHKVRWVDRYRVNPEVKKPSSQR